MSKSRASLIFIPPLRRYWEWVKTSIWLLPVALCVLALFLALLSLFIDRNCGACNVLWKDFYVDVETTRQLMGVLVTSVLSVGGVSFSVTMVALTLTSGQYGPKVLRHFLADTRSKLSLGLFFATAVYALTVFVALGAGDHPRFTTVVALALTVLAFLEFIGFIHRTAVDLQADQLIQRLGRQLRHDLRQLCTDSETGDRMHGTEAWRSLARTRKCTKLPLSLEGYVQTVNYIQLAQALASADAVALLRKNPGDFLTKGSAAISVWIPADCEITTLGTALESAITVGPMRTPIQDPEFPITQLQQVAARALSTGINDPGTAITCVDWFTLALVEVVDAEMPGATVLDDNGDPRLLICPPSFASIIDAIYTPLRQFAASDLQVTRSLLDSINRLLCFTAREDRLAALREQGERLWDQVCRESHLECDVAPLRRRYHRLFRRRGLPH